MAEGSYFGAERRRVPRDSRHTFGTVFVRRDDVWMAREMLILDCNDESMRIRAMPDLRAYDFRIQPDGSDAIHAPSIQRSSKQGDTWEFIIQLGEDVGRETLEGLKVLYDFPQTTAST